MTGAGKSDEQIARALHIESKTVANHRALGTKAIRDAERERERERERLIRGSGALPSPCRRHPEVAPQLRRNAPLTSAALTAPSSSADRSTSMRNCEPSSGTPSPNAMRFVATAGTRSPRRYTRTKSRHNGNVRFSRSSFETRHQHRLVERLPDERAHGQLQLRPRGARARALPFRLLLVIPPHWWLPGSS
jgi:hypothetical protein